MDDKRRELFWSKVQKADGCWLWTGATDHGYGRHGGGSAKRAHRLAYEDLVGPIPAGMVLDHLCHNDDPTCPGGVTCRHRRCVNPAHLEPASQGDNIRRGRGITAEQARRTTCRRGHALLQASGARRCRECTAEARERCSQRFLSGQPSRVKHGTPTGATLGCKCEPCLAARRAYCRAWRATAFIGGV
jgi:hypothetical protein